jgi:hypothetical protein
MLCEVPGHDFVIIQLFQGRLILGLDAEGNRSCCSGTQKNCSRAVTREQCDQVVLVPGYGVANPTRPTACGLPTPLSVNVMVPFRLDPRGENTLVNHTITVQEPPGAMTVPEQLSVSTEKK